MMDWRNWRNNWIGTAIGLITAVSAVAAAWFGFWGLFDRRFAELRTELHNVRTELHDDNTELRGELHDGNTELRNELRDVADNVSILVGRQQGTRSTGCGLNERDDGDGGTTRSVFGYRGRDRFSPVEYLTEWSGLSRKLQRAVKSGIRNCRFSGGRFART